MTETTDNAGSTPQQPRLTRREFLPVALGVQSGIVVLAFALGYALGHPFWTSSPLTAAAIVYGIALALPLSLVVIAIAERNWTRGPFGTLQKDFEKIVQLFQSCTIVDILVISLLAGVGEEALFRGVLQNLAAESIGPWPAIAAVSIVFGLAHAISIPYVVGVIMISLYLGAIYHLTGNLVVPIAAHAAYDFIVVVRNRSLRPQT